MVSPEVKISPYSAIFRDIFPSRGYLFRESVQNSFVSAVHSARRKEQKNCYNCENPAGHIAT